MCGCFRKWWYPQIIHFNRVFHYKPSFLGYPYFWKHSCIQTLFLDALIHCRDAAGIRCLDSQKSWLSQNASDQIGRWMRSHPVPGSMKNMFSQYISWLSFFVSTIFPWWFLYIHECRMNYPFVMPTKSKHKWSAYQEKLFIPRKNTAIPH